MERMRRTSARRVALWLALLPLAPARAADFVWEDPVPVSPAATDGSHRFHELLRIPGKDFRLCAIVSGRVARFSVRAYALRLGPDLDWTAAWDGRQEFTFDNGTQQSAYEVHAAVDSGGRLHVVYEAFNLRGKASIDIGYKTDAWPHWGPDALPAVISVPGASDCMGANPGLCVAKGPDGIERLHVLYHRRPLLGGDVHEDCRPFVYMHTAKPLGVADPAAGWGPESEFTAAFRAQEFVVAGEGGVGLMPVADGRGRLHAIGRQRVGEDSVRVCHVVGTPAGPGEPWRTRLTVLDSMPTAEGEGDVHEPPMAVPVQCMCGGPPRNESLDVVWNRNLRDASGTARREVRFARLDLQRDEWSEPIRLSASAEASAFAARIARADDGRIHVVYHEQATPGTRLGLRYRRADGDPRDPASWSAPQSVEHPDESVLGPVLVAEADTVWLGYTAEDAGAPPEQRWRAWFRKGYVGGGGAR